ncbi:valine--tRNA ligase, partial [Candidatus Uhrbacteria bacterium CG11_big_fil_rev_8_21_14_0_20_41_9]
MSDSEKELSKAYDPAWVEDATYLKWLESGFFNPDNLPNLEKRTEPFTIVLPPPNVTGTLHMGHAVMLAIEDAMIRFNRMNGKRALWLPGTDHAAIATESKVEKLLIEKEGINRHDLGREAFLERVNQFAQESHDTIVNQMKKMGASVDWSREAYTLDEERNFAVRTAFTQMYGDGLIYKGHRVINWDPKGQTTVSDEEVEYIEGTAKMYTFKYSQDFPISIATTRPETKVGDTAVAVNPEDPRYIEFVGKEYQVEFAGANLNIKIIADPNVDQTFGTGALGVTPAHSMVDSDMARNHTLGMVVVIGKDGRMTKEAGTLVAGQTTIEARETVVNWLRENNLLEAEVEITQNLSVAQRSGGVIEPLPMDQWFIDVNKEFAFKATGLNTMTGIQNGEMVTLKKLMQHAVKSEQIKILPERFSKTYFHWIDNLRDWNISRQIWFGHRVPVWYRGDDMYVGVEAPEGEGWEQDSDTLDTWFSSGLWTFSTLGWPKETDDLNFYHPTSVLETGYDILFF